MRGQLVRAALTPLLVLTLALPTHAGGTRLALPVQLASTSVPTPWFNSGVLAGRLGGVPVVGGFMGTSAIGIITLTVHRATFAYGSYACVKRACTFVGILAGVRVKGIALPINLRGVTRAVTSPFPNRRAWVAAVADWAKPLLSPDLRDQIVAEAAQITEL